MIKKKTYIYDIESYPNFFCVIFVNASIQYTAKIMEYIKADIKGDSNKKKDCLRHIDYRIFIISDRYFDVLALLEFLEEGHTFGGYNNHFYDDKILRFFIIYQDIIKKSYPSEVTEAIKKLSDTIIRADRYYSDENGMIAKVSKFGLFYSFDLMRMHYLDKKKKGLKQVLINLKWYRIQDLPYAPNKMLTDEEQDSVIDYCFNDTFGTRHLFHSKIEDVKLRINIKEKYKVDVLSSSRSSMADKLLYHIYTQKYGWIDKEVNTTRKVVHLGDLIDDKIQFSSPNLKSLLNNLKKRKIVLGGDEGLKDIITINNTNYQLGLGGLHTIDPPQIYLPKKGFCYKDGDVDSYYPRIIINRRIHPEHIPQDNFINTIIGLVEDRMYAKRKLKDKTLTEEEYHTYSVVAFTLKIVINSGLFGKLGAEYGFLKDHKALYETTINGQLYLLMWAEAQEDNNFRIISANTDGLLSKVNTKDLDNYYKIAKEWSEKLGFTLEFNEYLKYIRRNVNSYLALGTDGKIKVKNDFVYELENDPDHLLKGFDKPIVAIALKQYFVDGIPIEDTIYNHRDIYDFCMSKNIGSSFIPELHYLKGGEYVVKRLQKDIRYYVSNKGGTLVKCSSNKIINMVKGRQCSIFNDYKYYKDFKKYDINYNYYISEVYKILDELNRNTEKLIKKGYGTLFDELD